MAIDLRVFDLDRLRQWAEWLETTPLPQGKGALRSEDGGFCCLGIAELKVAEVLGVEPVFVYYPGSVIEGLCTFQSIQTNRWFGGDISQLELPFVANDDELPYTATPATANDMDGKTFLEIAAAIRLFCDKEEEGRKELDN